MAKGGVGLTWEGQGATGYGTGPQLVGAKLNHNGDGLPAKAARPSSNGRCCPTTSSRSTAAVTSACACSPRGFTSIRSPGSPPTPTNTTSECTRPQRTVRPSCSRERVDYRVAGGTLRVLGLADGQPLGDGVVYDDRYAEDVDNQIDIIPEGDDAAARSITHVEVPSSGDYLLLYNPGGPGPSRSQVRHSEPSPYDLEPVVIALDDPPVSNAP